MSAANDEGGIGARDANTPQNSPNNSTPIFVDFPDGRKEFATLQARLALAGYTVSELTHATYLICRWDRSIHCSDLSQVRAFLTRIGGVA